MRPRIVRQLGPGIRITKQTAFYDNHTTFARKKKAFAQRSSIVVPTFKYIFPWFLIVTYVWRAATRVESNFRLKNEIML